MRTIERSNQFKKDIKKSQKQTSPKRDMEELKNVMNMLAEDKQLPQENVIIILAEIGWVIENVTFNQTFF
jgi:mRNA-degrading endonuclease YafQ of YafQ-DinJ toxin-antitoxin module